MEKVTLLQGWGLFFKALFTAGPWRLEEAAEWMFRLNTFAREIGNRHSITDQIYSLKNDLIKYLYQHGYAVEVKKHFQNRECFTCDGTGEYWTGEPCIRCNGTGIYSTTWLYAFRFSINGRRFAWHQLEKLVNYPVELTTAEKPEAYQMGQGSTNIKDLHEAWLGCCVVWWCLLLHGVVSESLLFKAARNWLRTRLQRWVWLHTKDDIPF